MLSPESMNWASYLAEGAVASESFMEGIEDLPVQERDDYLRLTPVLLTTKY